VIVIDFCFVLWDTKCADLLTDP